VKDWEKEVDWGCSESGLREGEKDWRSGWGDGLGLNWAKGLFEPVGMG
jgi:hypothetical protein